MRLTLNQLQDVFVTYRTIATWSPVCLWLDINMQNIFKIMLSWITCCLFPLWITYTAVRSLLKNVFPLKYEVCVLYKPKVNAWSWINWKSRRILKIYLSNPNGMNAYFCSSAALILGFFRLWHGFLTHTIQLKINTMQAPLKQVSTYLCLCDIQSVLWNIRSCTY